MARGQLQPVPRLPGEAGRRAATRRAAWPQREEAPIACPTQVVAAWVTNVEPTRTTVATRSVVAPAQRAPAAC